MNTTAFSSPEHGSTRYLLELFALPFATAAVYFLLLRFVPGLFGSQYFDLPRNLGSAFFLMLGIAAFRQGLRECRRDE